VGPSASGVDVDGVQVGVDGKEVPAMTEFFRPEEALMFADASA
jgi:hypothetical protein